MDSTPRDTGLRHRRANTKNWYIAKLDYNLTKDGKQRLSLSGSMANENQAAAPFLPGQAPTSDLVNYSKGLIANYTATLKSTLVNSFRYGFIRESMGTIGNTDQTWSTFRGIDPTFGSDAELFERIPAADQHVLGRPELDARKAQLTVRIPDIADSKSDAEHDELVQQRIYERAVAEYVGIGGTRFVAAESGEQRIPGGGFQRVRDELRQRGDGAASGMDVEINAQYNYARDGSVLAQGAPVVRRYAEDGYETYVQDTWKVKPSLTVTAGLRYSLFSPPWETNGLEVTPTESLNTWFNNRGVGMNNGVPSIDAPPVAFNFSGPANGGTTGYYNWDWKNLGPRLAVAWSPGFGSGLLGNLFGGPGKSSVRAGFGIVYDRIGEGLLDTFDQNGAFGLSSSIQNAAGQESVACTPRITNLNVLPTTDNCGSSDSGASTGGELSGAVPEQSGAGQRSDYVGSR